MEVYGYHVHQELQQLSEESTYPIAHLENIFYLNRNHGLFTQSEMKYSGERDRHAGKEEKGRVNIYNDWRMRTFLVNAKARLKDTTYDLVP